MATFQKCLHKIEKILLQIAKNQENSNQIEKERIYVITVPWWRGLFTNNTSDASEIL